MAKATRRKAVSRGSRLLGSATISQGDLERLVALGQKQGIKLVNWHIYGQPVLDGVSGAFQVRPSQAGEVLAVLAKFRGLGLDVFPLGTPVPKEMIVRFRSSNLRRGGVIIHG